MTFNPFAQGSSSAPLLKDVFTIAEQQSQTFVLKLESSVDEDHLRSTLESYVVTDDIAANLHSALGYVEAGLSTGENQGIYLSGSFGSGKSHFMAVLYAILAGEPLTREIADLQPFVAKHEKAVNANLLQLTFHFLDSRSIEDTVFRGYLRQVSELHPEATPPVLHSAEGLFTDAEEMRRAMGDEAFFARLNTTRSAPSGQRQSAATTAAGIDISALGGAQQSSGWTSDTYDAARAPGAPEATRSALASALTETLFTSYAQNSEWLPLAEGLGVMSAHAKSFGYEGVVLMLDELILWLTFLVSDQEQFSREAQKLTLFVENKIGTMAIPLISFIARQHNLAYWQESSIEAGSTMEARKRSLSHQEGRFHNIELGDQNLPEIAHRRLLMPNDSAATVALDNAFQNLKLRPEISNVLLDGVNTTDEHQASNIEAFRLTYPFSPAIVDTLVHLSPAMQRERTALKVMESLLIDKRDTMRIDSVIPVGDAFDYIIQSDTGSQSRSNSSLHTRFSNGRKFWQEKLRPLIYKDANVDESVPESDLPTDARGKIRLGKTLVMAALAPEVPALKSMTASRLVHLNHGSMFEMFQGNAITSALQTVRSWAIEFPEIIIHQDSKDPVITLKLDEVPWEEVVDGARKEDTPQRRYQRIRKVLEESLGVTGIQLEANNVQTRKVTWHGTPREVEIIFGNVRDKAQLSDTDFVPSRPGALRLVVDLPFDEQGHTVTEDHRRIDALNSSATAPFTIAWLPQFFSNEQMSRLGELVIIDHVLSANGWRDYTVRLAEDARGQVRVVLTQRQTTLQDQLRLQISQAYGAAAGVTFIEGQEPLKSLDPSVAVSKPIGASMEEATDRLIEQAFDRKYPDHPNFVVDHQLRVGEFNLVLSALREASADRNGRADVSQETRRACGIILAPLKLAHVGESHIVFNEDSTGTTLTVIDASLRSAGTDFSEPIKVVALRNAVREINPRSGMSAWTVDLLVGAWAAERNRSWYQFGQQIEQPSIGGFDDRMELHPVALPSEESWHRALETTQLLFGQVVPSHLNGSNLTALQEKVNELVQTYRAPSQALATELGTVAGKLGFSAPTQRDRLAGEISNFLDALHRDRTDAVKMVEQLAAAQTGTNRILGASPQEAAVSLTDAAEVTKAIRTLNSGTTSQNLQTLRNYAAHRPGQDLGAAAILEELSTSLKEHEFKTPAERAVSRFHDRFAAWTSEVTRSKPVPDPTPTPGPKKSRTFEIGPTSDFGDTEKAITQEIKDNIAGGHAVRVTIERLDD